MMSATVLTPASTITIAAPPTRMLAASGQASARALRAEVSTLVI